MLDLVDLDAIKLLRIGCTSKTKWKHFLVRFPTFELNVVFLASDKSALNEWCTLPAAKNEVKEKRKKDNGKCMGIYRVWMLKQ